MNERGITKLIIQRAYEILKKAGRPMKYTELVSEVMSSFNPNQNISANTVRSQVYVFLHSDEYKTKVKKNGRGIYSPSETTVDSHTETGVSVEAVETFPESGKRSQPYQSFESYVKDFLNKMQFNDVNGGSTFKIGGKQIDASFGTSGGTYVIVSCTTGQSLESKINELKSWYDKILKGLKEIDSLKKYDKLKLVLATKGSSLSDREKKLCQSDPKVYIWNEQFFDYYNILFDKIDKYAKYELQRELEIALDNSDIEKLRNVPAIKITNGQKEKYYLAALNPFEILKIVYVARRERGDQNFYQRMINSEKLKKIAYDIEKRNLSFYNNVILSSQNDSGIEFEEMESVNGISIGKLTINAGLGSLWIVDGQHRIYSYAKVSDPGKKENAKIPVSIVVNKQEIEQGNLFISINTNQTKLSEDYKWDLYTMYEAKYKEKIAALTAKKLNELENLRNRIYIPSISVKKKHGTIGISKIARTIYEQHKLFNIRLNKNMVNPIYSEKATPEKNADKLANFLDKMLSEVKTREKQLYTFFLGSVGIQIFIMMISEYFLFYGGDKGTLDYIDCMCKYVSESGIFSDKEKIKARERTLSNRSEKSAFIYELAKGTNEQITKQLLSIPPLPLNESQTPEKAIERSLRDWVRNALSESGPNWFTDRIPADVRLNLESKGKSTSNEKLWDYIDLGSIIKVIEYSHNWSEVFEQKFINENSVFRDKSQVLQTLTNFKTYRDASSHGREITDVDKQYGQVAMQILRKFLNSQKTNENESEDSEDSEDSEQ
ncbi:MAG: DGQHR domain-containing protein [Candidatus Parvarchaeota archaeon]